MYNDGKYHIEYKQHEYLNGYVQSDWTLVNTLGEDCTKNGITLRFNTKENAQKFCDKANQCSEGGLITNFT
jgi:hypothetical protein